MNAAGALCLSTWVPPPGACPSTRPHAAALRRGEKGPNLVGRRGSGNQHGWGRGSRGGSDKKQVLTRSTLELGLPTVEKTSREEVERIQAFRVPDFVVPYPAKRNPTADNAKAESYRWLDVHFAQLNEVYRTPEQLRAFYGSDLAEWAVSCFADCGQKELEWACKLALMTFILDDHIDDVYSPERPVSSFFLELNVMVMWSYPDNEQLYGAFVDFLDKGEVVDKTEYLTYLDSKLAEARLKPGSIYDTSGPEHHWLCKSFQGLWAEIYESDTSEEFKLRWAFFWQTYLLENVTEIMNRKHKIIPHAEELARCRGHTAGVWIFVFLIQFMEKIYLPVKIWDSPEMQRMLNAASDALVFDNDLWSFQKEALLGDVHNMVVVQAKQHGCSYAEAGYVVHQMMLDRIAEMETAYAELEKVTPPEHQYALSRHWVGIQNMYSGTHVFYVDGTSRYLQMKAAAQSAR